MVLSTHIQKQVSSWYCLFQDTFSSAFFLLQGQKLGAMFKNVQWTVVQFPLQWHARTLILICINFYINWICYILLHKLSDVKIKASYFYILNSILSIIHTLGGSRKLYLAFIFITYSLHVDLSFADMNYTVVFYGWYSILILTFGN